MCRCTTGLKYSRNRWIILGCAVCEEVVCTVLVGRIGSEVFCVLCMGGLLIDDACSVLI